LAISAVSLAKSKTASDSQVRKKAHVFHSCGGRRLRLASATQTHIDAKTPFLRTLYDVDQKMAAGRPRPAKQRLNHGAAATRFSGKGSRVLHRITRA
jgi:hypothetical protein